MDHSLQLINSFLDSLFAYGPVWIYLALLTAAFIENVFPPFPGDFFSIAGAALAAAGRLNIFVVFLLIYAGGITSTMLVYWLGYSYGRDFFLRKNYPIFTARDIIRLENWFQKRGGWLLILNRFIVGGRSIITLVSGISRYDSAKMFLLTSISFWVFNGLLLFGSYIFVVEFKLIAEYFHIYERVVWLLIIVIALIYIIYRIFRVKKNAKEI